MENVAVALVDSSEESPEMKAARNEWQQNARSISMLEKTGWL